MMPISWRRRSLVPSVTVPRGEKVLAMTTATDGAVLAGTRDAFYVVRDGEPVIVAYLRAAHNRHRRPRLSLSFSLIPSRSTVFMGGRRLSETPSRGRVRPSPNASVTSWKAGWVYALTSSNLVSSAT